MYVSVIYLLIAIISFILGMFVDYIFSSKDTTNGVLRIDHSSEEKDIYRFEINDLENLNKKNKIVLKIDHYADLSPK